MSSLVFHFLVDAELATVSVKKRPGIFILACEQALWRAPNNGLSFGFILVYCCLRLNCSIFSHNHRVSALLREEIWTTSELKRFDRKSSALILELIIWLTNWQSKKSQICEGRIWFPKKIWEKWEFKISVATNILHHQVEKKVAFRDSHIFQRSLFVKNSTSFVLRT